MTCIWANIKVAIVALGIVSFVLSHPARAQSALYETKALNEQIIELYRAGKAGEAIPLAKRALAMREKTLPAAHPDIAKPLSRRLRLVEILFEMRSEGPGNQAKH